MPPWTNFNEIAQTSDPLHGGGVAGTRRGFEDWATQRMRQGLPYNTADTQIVNGRVQHGGGRITLSDLWPVLVAGGGIGLGALLGGGGAAGAAGAGASASSGLPALPAATVGLPATLPGTLAGPLTIPAAGAGVAGAGAAGAAGAGAGAATGTGTASAGGALMNPWARAGVSLGSIAAGRLAGQRGSDAGQGATLQDLLPQIVALLQQLQSQNSQRYGMQMQRYQSQQPLHDALSRMAFGLLPRGYTQGLSMPTPLSVPGLAPPAPSPTPPTAQPRRAVQRTPAKEY